MRLAAQSADDRRSPGDPYSDPWSDLAAYGLVQTKRFLFGLFYVSVVAK